MDAWEMSYEEAEETLDTMIMEFVHNLDLSCVKEDEESPTLEDVAFDLAEGFFLFTDSYNRNWEPLAERLELSRKTVLEIVADAIVG